MADTSTLQTPQPKTERVGLNQIIGGTFEDILETVTGVNRTPASYEARESITTPVPEYIKEAFTSGSIANFNEARPKTAEKLIAEQRAAVAEAESILKQSRARLVTQEELRYEVAGMPEEERNRRLHLSTSLKKEHTEAAYYMAELYRQAKEEISAATQQKEDTKMPSPAKQLNSLEVAFEGKSGSTGNLSFQAVG